MSLYNPQNFERSRGGIIVVNQMKNLKKFNSLVFPGTQGGPLTTYDAAKAAAFKEALEPEFKEYMQQVITNANVLAVNDGTWIWGGIWRYKNHLMLVSLVKQDLQVRLQMLHYTALILQ